MTMAIPPPYFISADDKRGLIVVTVALVLAFTGTCSAIRVWLRCRAKDWKPDDWLLTSATLLLIVQSGTLLHLVKLGLGVSQEEIQTAQLQQIGKEGVAVQVFYVSTLLLSKCSVLFLYLRLSSGPSNKLAVYILVAASLLWAIVSIVLTATVCYPEQYYTNPQECRQKRWSKWQAIVALDLITELCIFGIAFQLVWTLQMRMKAKVLVIFAFSARLPVVAISAIRLHYLHEYFFGTSLTFEYIVATQWHMGYAIMSSTITSIGPFLRPFKKEWSPGYYNSSSGYGQTSAHLTEASTNTRTSVVSRKPQRNSWQSEGYLMQPLPSRPSSKNSKETVFDVPGHSALDVPKDIRLHSASSSSSSDMLNLAATTQSGNKLTADANFRPIDHVSRNETEIWVGERSTTPVARDGVRARSRDERGLVINKSTQVTIEVNRASWVM